MRNEGGTMSDKSLEALSEKLDRLIHAVERLAPPASPAADLDAADCFV